MNLALFDFDGTLTNKDMFTRFILFSATPARLVLGSLFLSPLYLLYKIGIIPARKLRPFVSYCAFVGRNKQQLERLGNKYAQEVIPRYLRPEMLAILKRHQAEGTRCIVVSASLDLYLKPWCQSMGLGLICSEMANNSNRYSGYYVAGDCSCQAKANKITQRFKLADYNSIFAYGDTKEDLAMLALADKAYMRGVELKK
ncbi:HAD family hydrolase [Shewanella halifaxensis]|uniref:HAD family hydrolase n=1 Tax=Shewanella halifaxensis TaxID=271098 RepID=UPI000D597EA3|nr:HAD family hydrolase [Shewanella halifaxensis]